MTSQKASDTGFKGEDQASIYLKNQGYKILSRNFQKRYGEIDIVAKDKDTYVFIEVKTRTGDEFGTPEESITPYKLRTLTKTVQYYQLKKNLYDSPLRIDVISINISDEGKVLDLRHYKNVTGF